MRCKSILSFATIGQQIFIVAFCLIVITGCGSSGPEIIPVQGQVTYGGGQWPNQGVFFFTPAESGTGRAASANFDTEGRFSVSSYQAGNGLYPGKYRVTAQCWNGKVVIGAPLPPSFVPQRYQSGATSDLEVTVEPGQQSVEVNLDMPNR